MQRRMPLLIGAALIAAGLTTSGARAAGPLRDWQSPVGGAFRSARVDRGEWVYTTGVWQARGANTDGLTRQQYYSAVNPGGDQPTHIPRDLYRALTYDFFGAHRLTHNGDFQLPVSSDYPDGTGEVSEVRVTADTKNLYVRLLWNSMPSKDAQIATVTFEIPAFNQGLHVGQQWPANARMSSHYWSAVTVTGSGASLYGYLPDAPTRPDPSQPYGAVSPLRTGTVRLTSRVDVAAHTSEVAIPRRLLPGGTLVIGGGSGLADPRNPRQYWDVGVGPAIADSPGSGGRTTPTNVWELFFASSSPWTFDELEQSKQLSAAFAESSQTINPDALARRTSSAAPVRTGDFSVMFRSTYDGGDGIAKTKDGLLPVGLDQLPALPIQTTGVNETWVYTGRLQEYAMHVPAAVAQSPSKSRPLVVYLHGFTGTPEEPFTNPIGLVDAIDKKGWLLASALGRGDAYYSGIGDLDVMEVIRDVEQHYNVDPNRIYLMGHSMGGYGTDNIATHHPDLFAAVAPAEGTDSEDLALNLRNTPWFVMTADEDLDPGGQSALRFYDALSAQGLDATALEYRLKTHEYSSIYDTLPRLLDFFSSHVRNPNPATVTWVEAPGDTSPARQSGAYWLNNVKPWNSSVHTSVTVESMGIPHVPLATLAGSAVRVSKSVDEGGPTGRTIAQLHQTTPGKGAKTAKARTLVITAANVRTLDIDLTRVGIERNGSAATLEVHTQSPLTVRLVYGSRITTQRIAAGAHTVRVTP